MALKNQAVEGAEVGGVDATEAGGSGTGHGLDVAEHAPLNPPRHELVIVDEVSSDENIDLTGVLHAWKRLCGFEGTREDKYVPDWNIHSSDYIISKAHEPARMLGGHLCRGVALPKDKVIMAVVDLLQACTKLMASLSIISVLPCLFLKHTFPLSDIFLILTHVLFSGGCLGDRRDGPCQGLKSRCGFSKGSGDSGCQGRGGTEDGLETLYR